MKADILITPPHAQLMGANKVSLKKTLLCVATVSALTMIAGGAAAATNEYSLQYNGIGVKAEYNLL